MPVLKYEIVNTDTEGSKGQMTCWYLLISIEMIHTIDNSHKFFHLF